MDNEKFERSMKRLKHKYEEVESTTSSQEIIQRIELEKSKRKKRHYLSGIAASIVALLIGGYLFSSFLYTDQASNGDLNNGDATVQNQNDDEPNNREDNAVENEEEPPTDTEDQEITEVPDDQRPATKSLTVYPEGMEETIQMRLHVSDHLGYATYVEENMILVETNENGKDVEYFYVDFAATGEIAFEDAFIRVEKFADTLLEDVEPIMVDRVEAAGFTYYEFNEEDVEPLENSSKHLLFITNDLTHYLTLVENGNDIYAVQTQMLVEMSDGYFPWIMEDFVKEMHFY